MYIVTLERNLGGSSVEKEQVCVYVENNEELAKMLRNLDPLTYKVVGNIVKTKKRFIPVSEVNKKPTKRMETGK